MIKKRIFLNLITLLFLALPVSSQTINCELGEIGNISLATKVPDEYLNFLSYYTYDVKKNGLLSFSLDRTYLRTRNLPFILNFTSETIPLDFYKFSVSLNGTEIFYSEKETMLNTNNNIYYYSIQNNYTITSNSSMQISFDVINFIRPKEFKIFKIKKSDWFYPFDEYYLNLTEGPNYYNKKILRIRLPEYFEFNLKESRAICPNRIGQWFIFPLTEKLTNKSINITFTTDLYTEDIEPEVAVKPDEKLNEIVIITKSTQSGILSLETSKNTCGDYSNSGCNTYISFSRTFKDQFFFFILFISSIISPIIYANMKFLKGFLLYIFTNYLVVIGATWSFLDRPNKATLFEIIPIILYLSIYLSLFIFSKFKKREQPDYIR